MPMVTLKVDPEMKAQMDRLEAVNWSQILRERIYEVLDREARKNRMEALRSIERLRRKPAPRWDSTKFIRQTREARFGPRGHRR